MSKVKSLEWSYAVEETKIGADVALPAISEPLIAQPEAVAVLKTQVERTPRSPYTKSPITINVGLIPVTYYVPWHLLKSTFWSSVPAGGEISLPTLGTDVGHILVHYLYTGEYQPLESKAGAIAKQPHLALKQALLVYRASVTHALGELELLARQQIKEHSALMDPKTILDIIWSELSRKSEPSGWLQEFLEGMIQQAFERDHTVFADDAFCASLRNKSKLNDFVMHHVMKLLSEKLTQALAGQGSIAGNSDTLLPAQPIPDATIAEEEQNDGFSKQPGNQVENNMEEVRGEEKLEVKEPEADVIAEGGYVGGGPPPSCDTELAFVEQPGNLPKPSSPMLESDESWEAPPPANDSQGAPPPTTNPWEIKGSAHGSWEISTPAQDGWEVSAPAQDGWETPALAPSKQPIVIKKKKKRFQGKKVAAEATKV